MSLLDPIPTGCPLPCPTPLGPNLQWGTPSSGSPQLWEGIILVTTGGWGICGVTLKWKTQGVAPYKPHISPWTMPGWVGGAAWGGAPVGMKGLRAPSSCAVQM